MRIGIFILAAGRTAGGPETYEVELIRGLARIDSANGYFVYCTAPAAAAALGPLPANFTVRVLRPAVRAVSVSFTLPRLLVRDRVDLLHCTYAAPPFPNRPLVFTMHCVSNFVHPEFYPTVIRWRLNWLQRIALRRALSILCVSDFVARSTHELFGIAPERLTTVHHGVGPEFSPIPAEEARARVPVDGSYVLYLGKVEARKNIAGLIRAYAEYRKRGGSAGKLVLAGKRSETAGDIAAAIASHGLEREVVQLGYVEPALRAPLYAAASMAVFPSFWEGFGMPLIEAMACGCPVVASNVTSLPEIAGDAALLVDPNDPAEIAAAMRRLESDSTLRATLIDRGFRRASRFTWDETARRTLAAYKALSG